MAAPAVSPARLQAARAVLAAQRNAVLRDAGRAAAWTRDVPASCICEWAWIAKMHRYILAGLADGCPWHWDVDL